MAISRKAAILLTAGSISGCAGGMGTVRHTTLIETEPAGAVCALKGDGFASEAIAPARVEIPKAAAPIALTCRAAGHKPLEVVLKPLFNPKIFGNFAVGSSLGLVSDMIGGHDEIYPKRVRLNLEPNAFATVAARDAWFDRYRRATRIRWQMRLNALGEECDGTEDTLCHARVENRARERDAQLATLERRRDAARIADDIAERPGP